MTRISEKKARELGLMPKRSKYGSRKTVRDGITFDSKHEADYYCELKLRQRAGDIQDFELQPEFILQEGFKKDGKKIRPIKYRADFRVMHRDGTVEIVDTKGYRTKEYQIKKKLLLAKYPGMRFTEA